jgi:hypothetical protein
MEEKISSFLRTNIIRSTPDNFADQIIEQTQRIDDMIRKLDQRWIESEKVLGFLKRHYQVSFELEKTD